MYAGTPSLVVSLWSVADEATAQLMADFYRRMLKQCRSPSAALQEAQLKLLGTRLKDPFYWAAFQFQGDWRALSSSTFSKAAVSTTAIHSRER